MTFSDDALEAWLTLVPSLYDDTVPTPRNIASDLEVYINGVLMYRSIGECRSMWRELQRRYPDWKNDFIQAFGDENGQCIVWRATGTAGDGSSQQLDMHGVTMLESDQGVVRSVNFYFESGSDGATFASSFGLRPVAI
ncbi:hypothetical protein JT358_02175 [Micrococcales bacterium 31B]|nr:hypothetical protein [Micrococcales bacterium 31B]